MLTSQFKLMAVLAGLVVLGVMVSSAVSERGLRRDQLSRVEQSLVERARLVRDLLGDVPFDSSNRVTLDALAHRAGDAGAMRVTLIALDGTVVGDSGIRLDRLATVENHANRPEVIAALAGNQGSVTRHSDTIGQELLYVALPASDSGIVRVAVALSELDAARSALRLRLVAAGALGLLFAVALSYLVTRSALKPIREVRHAAEAIARGDLEEKPPIYRSNELAEISNAIRDIASQLRSRLEEATDEKERLRAVLESMVEGVLVVDADATILLANSRLREFFDIHEEVEGRPFLSAIRNPEVDSLLRDVELQDKTVVSTLRVGAAPRTLRVQAVRFPRTGAPRSGSVAVFHDISELERLEDVRRDFVANASHELRTPLAAIQGFAETLLGSDLSEEKRRSYLEIIERHALRLGAIVNDLLSLSTAETGKLQLSPMPLDVTEAVRGVVRDLEPRWREGELNVHYETEGETVALADSQALVHILTNLLDNAIKYSEPSSEIEIGIRGDATRVRISVRDTGIGIPAEDTARIFERFYRVDRARSRKMGGTGLGLSIVRHLVQAQGGEISVQSRLGEGTTFSFSLPKPTHTS